MAVASMLWGADLNSPQAPGFVLRGKLFYSDAIYGATIDQMTTAGQLSPGRASIEEMLFYTAMSSLRSGDDEALSLLEGFLDEYPVSSLRPLAQCAIGDYYFMRGDYNSALQRYLAIDDVALAESNRDDLDYRRSYSQLLLGKFNEASIGFGRLERSRTYAQPAKFYQAYIDYAKGDYESALTKFRAVDSKMEPCSAAPYYIAQILYLDRDWTGALDASRRILNNPTFAELNPEAERIAGESLYNLGCREDAMPYLWRYASAVENPAPTAFYILGTSEYDKGNYSEAIGLLQKVISENSPLSQSAYLYLGQAYSKTGNRNAALMAFENAYRMNHDRKVAETAFYNFVVSKTEGGRMPFASSVALLEDFLKQYPDSPYGAKIGESLVSGYLSDNDYEAALGALSKIKHTNTNLDKARQRILFVLGTREYTNGSYGSALERFNAARKSSSLSADIALQSTLWAGECNYKLERYAAAIADYKSYLSRAPKGSANIAVAHYDLGYALFADEQFKNALEQFNEFLKTDRKRQPLQLADAYARIADCRYYSGDIKGALADYRRSFDANPATGDYALYQLAVMQGLNRDHKAKIATVDRLTETFPESGIIPAALLQKAESQGAIGQNEQAVATYREITTRYPNAQQGRKATLQLAITYLSMGNRKKAIETYKSVVTTYPTSEEARLAVDDLKRIYADDGKLSDFSAFMASIPNAPAIDASEYDSLAFNAAEKAYVERDNTTPLENYLADYPAGAYEAQALWLLANAAVESGSPEKALGYSTKLALRHPDNENIEEALFIKAEAETDLKRLEPAMSTYTELSRRASNSENLKQANLGIMRSALGLKRYADALAAADKLMATAAPETDDYDEIGYSRGAALKGLGRAADAEKQWTEVVKATPTTVFGAQSAVAEAQSLFDRKHVKESHSKIDAFINANPPQPYWLARGFILLSDILRSEGNDFEAKEYIKSLKANYPGNEKDIFRMIDERLK